MCRPGVVLGIVIAGLVCAASLAQAPASGEPGQGSAADAMGFLRVRVIRGNDWDIAKFKNPDGLWHAQLNARGAKVTEFGECGDNENWMRFMLWPVDAADPSLLLVLRYAGGAHGSDSLDIIHLKENFRSVFRSIDQFNFNQVKDFDNDGMPEVVGVSRHYAYMQELSRSQSPYPTVVFSYRPDAKQFLCQNHRFTSVLEEKAVRYRSAFEKSTVAKGKYEYDRWSDASREAFSSLLSWVLETCYMGQEEAAWAYLNEFTTPKTATLIRNAVTEKMSTEPYYQDLKRTLARDKTAAN